MTVALCFMALIGSLFLAWNIVDRSGVRRESASRNESGSITRQPSRAVLHAGGDGLAIQSVMANCAKGYVRRGSVCEADTTQMALSAASNLRERNSVRSPERE
jgi:hypothetical protein